MNLSSARDAKLALQDALNRTAPVPAAARGKAALDEIRPQARAHPPFAVGFAPTRIPLRKRPDYRLAVRVYQKTEAAGRAALRELFRRDPALTAETEVVYGVRTQPRGLTLRAGNSGAHFEVGAGTMGAFVANSADVYVLGCNHTLANRDRGRIDDPIVHPSRNDASDLSIVGRLAGWIPLGRCTVDAAIAGISDRATHYVPRFYRGIGSTPSTIVENLNEVTRVIKLGKSTGITTGTVASQNTDGVVMDYGGGVVATFDDQIEIVGEDGKRFSKRGDSGAVILDRDTNRPYALLFGGGIGNDGVDRTWAHFLPVVFSELGVWLAT